MIKYPRKFTDIQEKEICKQYIEEEISTVALSKMWKCDPSTITFILRKRGYRVRSLSEAQKGKRVGKDNSFYGKHHSEETKRKNSEFHKGKKAWNKGLTKETNEKVKSMSKKLEKRTLSDETKRKISKVNKGKKAWNKNKKLGPPSVKTRKKISKANKGRKSLE